MVKNFKRALGFDNPKESITIFKGDTYSYLDWFRKSTARYCRSFGWYVPGSDEVPSPLPYGIEPVELKWSTVSEDGVNLLPESTLKSIVGNMTHNPTNSEYFGNVGERHDFILTLNKTIVLDGANMYLFTDDLENEFVWITAAAQLTDGVKYKLRGTIKDHRIYNSSKQTILTRCRIQGEL